MRSKRFNWGELKKNLESGNVEAEETEFPEKDLPSAFGFVVNKEGPIFIFPKSWEKKPLHKIPGTNKAVSICGEIDYIKPEDLKGIDLIYNPSAEGDDLLIGTRMKIAEMKKKSGSVEKEVIEKILQEDKNFGFLNQPKSPLTEERIEKEMRLWGFPRELTIKIINKDQERNQANFHDKVNELHKGASSRHLSSSYGKQINEIVTQKNIPVIRCDISQETSGVLNPQINASINRSDHQGKFTRINISR